SLERNTNSHRRDAETAEVARRRQSGRRRQGLEIAADRRSFKLGAQRHHRGRRGQGRSERASSPRHSPPRRVIVLAAWNKTVANSLPLPWPPRCSFRAALG